MTGSILTPAQIKRRDALAEEHVAKVTAPEYNLNYTREDFRAGFDAALADASVLEEALKRIIANPASQTDGIAERALAQWREGVK